MGSWGCVHGFVVLLNLLHSTLSTFPVVIHERGGTVMAGEGMRREEDFENYQKFPGALFSTLLFKKRSFKICFVSISLACLAVSLSPSRDSLGLGA